MKSKESNILLQTHSIFTNPYRVQTQTIHTHTYHFTCTKSALSHTIRMKDAHTHNSSHVEIPKELDKKRAIVIRIVTDIFCIFRTNNTSYPQC